MDLYAKYIKEREDSEIFVEDYGFVTYRAIPKSTVYYLVDMYILPEFRKTKKAWELHDKVLQTAKAAGATQLLTSVCLDANGVSNSMAVILAGGFQYSSSSGNMLYFVKDV